MKLYIVMYVYTIRYFILYHTIPGKHPSCGHYHCVIFNYKKIVMLYEIVDNTIRERRNKNIEAMYIEATSVSAAVQYKVTKSGSTLAALILFFLNPRRHVWQNTRSWASL